MPDLIKPAKISPAAARALAEAEARRSKAASEKSPPVEHGGRKGPEPVRYGDWERNGIAVDF
ncbi:MAG: succinate dehydrogenase assembly factor 4 [Paracoccaceae bacterium]